MESATARRGAAIEDGADGIALGGALAGRTMGIHDFSFRWTALLSSMAVAFASPAQAEPSGCTAPLKPMLRAELFFGRNIGDRFGAVTERQWQTFVDRELTPRFPAGLTILEGLGQSAERDILVREPSKVVIIVTADDPATHERIAAATNAYLRQFKQKSVGLVTQAVCAAF